MWLTLALGVWLVVSPFVLGYSDINAAIVNNFSVGAVAIILSATALFVRPIGRWAWLLVPVGAWQAIAPLTLEYSEVAAAFANAIVVGVAIVVLAIIGGLTGRTLIAAESMGRGDARPDTPAIRDRSVREDEERRRRAA
jgi:hypothetical protein